MLPELERKEINIVNIALKALEDTELLSELLNGLKIPLLPPKTQILFACMLGVCPPPIYSRV